MHAKRREAVLVELHRAVGAHLDPPEAVIVEVGREGLLAVALERIVVGLEAQSRHRIVIDVDVAHLDAAVVLEQFAVLHLDLHAPLARNFQPAQSRHILAEVEHIDRIAERTHPDGFDLARGTDAGHRLRRQNGRGSRYLEGRLPCPVVEARTVPARNLQTGVVGVAAVNVVLQIGTRSRLPRPVRSDHLARAVSVDDIQLADHPRAVAPAGVLEIPCRHGRYLVVEAVAEHGGHDGLARTQQLRHVVGRIQVALVVMRVAGFELVLGHRLAVDRHLAVGRGAHIQPRLADAVLHSKRLAQHRRGSEVLIVTVGDPFRRPATVGHRRLEAVDRRADDPSGLVPCRRAPVVARAGLQRQSGVALYEAVPRNDLGRGPYVARSQRVGERLFGRSDPHAALALHEILVARIGPCETGRHVEADPHGRAHVLAPHVFDLRGAAVRAAGSPQCRRTQQDGHRSESTIVHKLIYLSVFI